ncbi:unnamed protein product [Rotaria magnacalcarata]
MWLLIFNKPKHTPTPHKATIRHIEVQQWSQVIILNTHDSKQVTRYRKPPSMLSLKQFSSWIAIGFPSSSIYHLTSFNILVFERIFGANKYSLVYAFVQCTGFKCSSLTNDVRQSVCNQDALKIIQNHPALDHLNDTLVANVKTKYICDFCYKKYCTNCNDSIENIVMNSHQQVFLKCPYYLISCTTAIPSINTTTTLPSTIDNNTASASSQMRIVSQTNVNGVKRLVITNGNHFFSITTPTNTKTS